MKLLPTAPAPALALAAALSLAACSGNSAPDNAAAVEPSTLNQDALEATENLTVTDTPPVSEAPGNEAPDGNAFDAPATNLTTVDDTGGNAL